MGCDRPELPSQEYGLGLMTDIPMETSNQHSVVVETEKHIRCEYAGVEKRKKVENVVMPLCKFTVHLHPEHGVRFWCPHQSGYVRMGKVEKG